MKDCACPPCQNVDTCEKHICNGCGCGQQICCLEYLPEVPRCEKLAKRIKGCLVVGEGGFSYEEISDFTLAELESFRVEMGNFARSAFSALPPAEREMITELLIEVGCEVQDRWLTEAGRVIQRARPKPKTA